VKDNVAQLVRKAMANRYGDFCEPIGFVVTVF